MSLRDLPSIDRLLQSQPGSEMEAAYGRELTLQALRETLDAVRSKGLEASAIPDSEQLLRDTQHRLVSWLAPTLRPVINATGVILHTNLGRAPLSQTAQETVQTISRSYNTLEYDLQRGGRGTRDQHAEHMLTRLTGAEAALVVNNNAAAVLLSLTALAHKKQVVISRSQLVEIGGGFRIPDVMKQSGAKLVEVGTTNRTHLSDFETAIEARTALIMRAHHSNFKIVGFTTEPSLAELVRLGLENDIPVLDDLGSGALIDTAQFGLGHEPTVQESIQVGAPLVAFSGDKLLGGPQAGLLVGRADLIKRLKRHPLARAVRPDKLCLAALSATLGHYLKGEALREIPIWQMIAMDESTLQARAHAWRKKLGRGEVVPGRSTVGGGSLPEESLPTWLLALAFEKPDRIAAQLRANDPPIIARIEDDHLLFDPRTVLAEQDVEFVIALGHWVR
ncbi:MAG: L-seryl-tRNA(Sec) selenium transferase [Anaerolineales bacterium]|nr:MAG: L-seryl-tRNA(Sec) selenium transferase [Anaerolineales bacterium]